MKGVREILDIIWRENFNQESLYSEKAKVTVVDDTAGTCTVQLVADDTLIEGVVFKTVKDDTDGMWITPKVNSYVIVTFLSNELAFVSLVQQWSKVTIKNGANSIVLDGTDVVVNAGTKTVALAPDVVTRLNTIESDLNALKTVFGAGWGTPVAGDGGGALKTAAATWLAATLTPTVDGDIESPNFKSKD